MRIVNVKLSEVILKGLEVYRKMLDCGLGLVSIGDGGNFVVAFSLLLVLWLCCCHC